MLDETVVLIIPSHPKFMRVLRNIVTKTAGLAGFNEKERQDIALAVTEGCSNIIKYSYENNYDQKIVVKCRTRDKLMETTLRDYGRKMNPNRVKPRRLQDVRPGGLGVHLMQSLVDQVKYIPHSVGTELKLIKYCGRGEH